MNTLTERDAARLASLEAIIESGRDSFLATGMALAQIRDSRLYRQDHETFEDYLDKRWNISRSRGYQLIAFAKDAEMSTIVDKPVPKTEWQSRKRRQSPSRAAKPEPSTKEAEAQTSTDDDVPHIKTADQELAEAMGFDNAAEALEAVKESKLPKTLLESLDLALESIKVVMDADFEPHCEAMRQVAKDVRRAANELERFAKTVCGEAS